MKTISYIVTWSSKINKNEKFVEKPEILCKDSPDFGTHTLKLISSDAETAYFPLFLMQFKVNKNYIL